MEIARETLIELYIGQKKSECEIAKILGCSNFYVHYLLVKYEVPRRARSNAIKLAYAEGRREPPVLKGSKRWYYSASMKGKKHSQETKSKMGETSKRLIREGKKKVPKGWNKGKTWDEIYGVERAKELKQKFAEMGRKQVGEKHPRWKGGTTLLRRREVKRRYKSPVFQENRLKAFERDNYTCGECGIKPSKPVAHHIIPYRISKDHLASNLLTTCRKCHARLDDEFQNAHSELYPDARSTEFKSGLVPWSKGLNGEEYLKHFKSGKVWNKGLTKETDSRVRTYGLRESQTKRSIRVNS